MRGRDLFIIEDVFLTIEENAMTEQSRLAASNRETFTWIEMNVGRCAS